MKISWLLRLAALMLLIQSLGVDCPNARGQANKVRKSEEDVNAPEVRSRQGLQPSSGLLFNGWGITPAGSQVQVSDMPLKMIVAPDKKTILAVSGGFRN